MRTQTDDVFDESHFVLVAGMEDNIGNSIIPDEIGVLIYRERPLRAIKVKGNGNCQYSYLSNLLNSKCNRSKLKVGI